MNIKQLKDKFHLVSKNHKLENMTSKLAKSLNTAGTWSNREEEWYFVNKRLLFATQSEEACHIWIKKLKQMVIT